MSIFGNDGFLRFSVTRLNLNRNFVLLFSIWVMLTILLGVSLPVDSTVFYSVVVLVLLYIYWYLISGISNVVDSFQLGRMLAISVIVSIVLAVILECLTACVLLQHRMVDCFSFSFHRFGIYFVCLNVFATAASYIISKQQLMQSIKHGLISLVLIGLVWTALSLSIYTLSGGRIGEISDSQFSYLFLTEMILICASAWAVVIRYYRNRLDVLILISLLSVGMYIVLIEPPIVGLSWDDQIHFARSLSLSFLGEIYLSDADSALASVSWVTQNQIQFDMLPDVVAKLNMSYQDSVNNGHWTYVEGLVNGLNGSSLESLSTFGAIPSAFGLWLARTFGLTFTSSLVFGRLANLLFYGVVVSYAVMITPRYKEAFAVSGIMSTGVFLASNYSYDPWICSIVILALAIFVRANESADCSSALRNILLFAVVMFVGIAPKLIYFPLLFFPLLFLRSNVSSETRKRIVAIIGCFALACVILFVAPMLFSQFGLSGDSRGGSDVNSKEQILYIISHPLTYLGTLIAFLLGYLSPIGSDGFSLNFAYFGNAVNHLGWLSCLPFIVTIVMICVSYIVRRDGSRVCYVFSASARFVLLSINLLTVVLIATSLYVSFTPVGLSEINGCQARYLLPLVAPTIIAIHSGLRTSVFSFCGVVAVLTIVNFLVCCVCLI